MDYNNMIRQQKQLQENRSGPLIYKYVRTHILVFICILTYRIKIRTVRL